MLLCSLALALIDGAILEASIDRWAKFAYESVEALTSSSPLPPITSKTPSQGVFVTIELNGEVVACRGSLKPSVPTLEEQIQVAAKSAALFDPRYGVVRVQNKRLSVTVTLVDRLEPLQNITTLRVSEGLVLHSNVETGIVLPFEGRDPMTRLDWAYRKAKVNRNQSVKLERMSARRARYPETEFTKW